ncbi:MAG: VOC family protein [Chloroflexota bacterium]
METLESNNRIAIDVGLVVTDLERSLDFYQHTLGLTYKLELQTSLIGKGRMIQLVHGESLLKLIEFEKQPAASDILSISQVTGIRYITLMVKEIHDLLSKVEDSGYQEQMPLTQLGNGALIAMVSDPDGNIVELVQEVNG